MIDAPVIFKKEHSDVIARKKGVINFSHHCWSDDDLQDLRTWIREFYRVKQNGVCAYCREAVSLQSAANCHVEHIVPKSLHPDFMFLPKNLCVICADCNAIKRAQETIAEIPDTINESATRKKYPRSSSGFKIVHPHYDPWADHIIKYGKAFVDKTPKGGFTIQTCKLNRRFHKFGLEDEFADDEELHSLMNEYMTCTNSLKKGRLLNKIRELVV